MLWGPRLSLVRTCHYTLKALHTPVRRGITTSPVLFLAVAKKSQRLSKREKNALAKKKALKRRGKNIYDREKMALTDAINVLRAVEVTSPNSTYELVIKADMKRATTIPKGRILLPRQVKPKPKETILVFAEGRHAEDARKAGADIVGGLELADAVASGRHQATTVLCTPSLIRAITPKLGRILGPRGLMPSERRGTVTEDIAGYIERLQGTAEWRGDRGGVIRTPIAKLHFPVSDVVRNVRHFVGTVRRLTTVKPGMETRRNAKSGKRTKPASVISKILLSSAQGPSIQISDA